LKLKRISITVEWQVFLALTLGLVVVIAAAIRTAADGLKLSDAQTAISAQEDDLRTLEQVRNAVQRAESAQRSYLLTGREEDLIPYGTAQPLAEQALTRLKPKGPTGTDMTTLAVAVRERFAEIDRALKLQQSGEQEQALALVRDDTTWRRAQRLDERMGDEIEQRRKLLAGLEYSAGHRRQHAWIGGGMLILMAAVFLLAVNFTILRHMRARRKLTEQLRFEASHDALTGLPNRRYFAEWARYALGRVRRDGDKAAVLFLDLDGFKQVNDEVGHDLGDKALIEVAQRFQRTLRDGDLVARLGGDEFAVLVPAIHQLDEIGALAGRMIDSLAQPLLPDHPDLMVGVSVGVALYPESGTTIEELLDVADGAMYESKRMGRNRFWIHRSDPTRPAMRAEILMQDLYRAADQHELFIQYQPKVDLETQTLAGVEALLRWRHPSLGVIGPGEFIELAERSGAILALGDWMFEEIGRQMARWRRENGFRTQVSINVTSKQLRSGRLSQRIAEVLKRYDLSPGSLEIELIERSFIDPEASRELPRLKQLGLRVAIDDFGTGYSSLSYLKHFAVDAIKIDRSFVDGLPHEPFDCELTKTICALALNLGMDLIAEGVEDPRQAEFLRGCGCHVVQGWLYSAGLDPADVPNWRVGPTRPALVRNS